MASITTPPFFLHSRGEHYLAGIANLPLTLKEKLYSLSYVMIAAYGVMILGLATLLYGGYLFFTQPPTTTNIVNLTGWMSSIKRDDAQNIATLTYRYTYQNQTYYGTSIVDRQESFEYLPGEPVELNFKTDAPENAQIGTVEPFFTIPFPVMLGALLLVAGLLLAAAIFIYRHQYRKLFQSNQVVDGEVMSVREHDLHNDRYEIEIFACFTAPDTGKWIEGRRRYQVDMVKAALLPEVGAALRIVYLNSKVWEIL